MATDIAALPEQLVRTGRFTLGQPGGFTVSADGGTVLFLRTRAGDDPVACLWALDVRSGAERMLADPAELCPDAPGGGIAAYAADDSGGVVAFALGGAPWVLDVATGRARPLTTKGPVAEPRPDPSGLRIAYTAGGALMVVETDGGGARPVARPDGPHVAFGTADHTAAVAPGEARGFWWAPDGERLLVVRADSARVPLWHLGGSADPTAPPTTVRYTAVGEPHAELSLWITALDGTRIRVDHDAAAFPYLVDAAWDAHGPYAVVASRDQRRVRMLAIDPADGATTVLAEQHDPRWVAIVPGLPARTASGALLGHDDGDGTRRLTVDGEPVSPPGLHLRAVLGADGDGVLFTASHEAAETHLWSWQAGDGEVRRLSDAAGVHSGTRRGGTLVRVAEGVRPYGRAEIVGEGRPSIEVAAASEPPVLDARPARLVLGPRELRADLYLPSWHRPGGGPLPVLLDPYGGPNRQRVTAAPDWRAPLSQWFAEQGFAVLVCDGRGTPGRGPEWERALCGDLFGPALEDQVTALHETAGLYPELDLSRVGIRGSSFGGTLAALAVMHRPDCFHAAVVASAVTDQRLFHARSRERFLGHPDAFPERYDALSVLRAADRLTRPVLLVHGLADTNVHPANTLRLSRALLAAGRPHELLLLPGVGHQVVGSAATADVLGRQRDFLRAHLRASAPHG